VANQSTRWGSCTVESGAIRISERLRGAPGYVVDAVLIHELCHLTEPGHTPAFKALVARTPRLAEAEAYLAGMQFALGAGSPRDPELLA
jgi:predicted metal-dependent hydrolase